MRACCIRNFRFIHTRINAVLHALKLTVGPIYGRAENRESELLSACYQNSLALAVEQTIKTIAIPSISTGALGYPREEAAKI